MEKIVISLTSLSQFSLGFNQLSTCCQKTVLSTKWNCQRSCFVLKEMKGWYLSFLVRCKSSFSDCKMNGDEITSRREILTSRMRILSSRLLFSEEDPWPKDAPLPSFFLAIRNSTSRFRIYKIKSRGKGDDRHLLFQHRGTLIKNPITSASFILTRMGFHLLSKGENEFKRAHIMRQTDLNPVTSSSKNFLPSIASSRSLFKWMSSCSFISNAVNASNRSRSKTTLLSLYYTKLGRIHIASNWPFQPSWLLLWQNFWQILIREFVPSIDQQFLPVAYSNKQ